MKINCCPKCGGTIIVSRLNMYSLSSPIGKRGKLLKKTKYHDDGSLDQMLACCEKYISQECDVTWNGEEFFLDENEYFVDLKYTESSKGW